MPEDYFMKNFLQADTSQTVSTEIVPQIAIALALVWVLAIIVMAMGVDEGIGKISKVFMPLLTVLFIIVVIQALFLDGAAEGLNAFFTPNWNALRNPTVWVAAYGQIFFSLSVGFGIMLTYSSYLKPRTNLTGTGLVTALRTPPLRCWRALACLQPWATWPPSRTSQSARSPPPVLVWLSLRSPQSLTRCRWALFSAYSSSPR